jgi:ABC-type phosphate transport system permease subunit
LSQRLPGSAFLAGVLGSLPAGVGSLIDTVCRQGRSKGEEMSATIVSLIAFAAMFGGAILGMGVRVLLPPRHLSSPSRDVVRLCIAILATVSSLVIGLLIASAKSSFDERTS